MLTKVRWVKEDRGFDTPCWIWQLGKTTGGYGRERVGGRSARLTLAHRNAYERAHGSIPDGMEVDHLCRQTSCVNPEHLEAVTRAENNRRAFSKLTADEVREIRASTGRQVDLAARFGVDQTTISAILLGKRYIGL